MEWRPLPPRMERRRIATGGDPSERTHACARAHESDVRARQAREREHARNRYRRDPWPD